jgi:hypothetical protein
MLIAKAKAKISNESPGNKSTSKPKIMFVIARINIALREGFVTSSITTPNL